MVNVAQAPLASIDKLEVMVERHCNSFPLFMGKKILTHRVEIEGSLDDIKEEIIFLSKRVVALVVFSCVVGGNSSGYKVVVNSPPSVKYFVILVALKKVVPVLANHGKFHMFFLRQAWFFHPSSF